MKEIMSVFLLLSVPALPLLLAFPALRSYLPRPCYFTLLPVIILVAVPMPFSIEIPWLLFGSGLAIDEISRLLLAMSVVIWVVSAAFLHASGDYSSDGHFTTCFMLTMAGNLGAILAADLMTFFVFLTLMGYGFYALLISGGGEEVRQSGRVYLIFMIIADLVLFEALLIVAAATDNLGFEAVRYAMTQTSSSDLYLSMVVIGFAARAGFWPLSFWLPLVFRSSRPAVTVLLGGVPIAIGMLGIIRWLPLGEITSPELGMILQSLGVAAILYAVFYGLIRAQLKMLPVYAAIMITGFYVITLGIGFTDPAAWKQYGYLLYFFIASFGISFAVLVVASWQLQSKYAYPMTAEKQSDYLSRYFKRYFPIGIARLMGQIKPGSLYLLCTNVDFLWSMRLWKRVLDYSEYYLQHWRIAITLFLLLGIIMVIVGVLSF